MSLLDEAFAAVLIVGVADEGTSHVLTVRAPCCAMLCCVVAPCLLYVLQCGLVLGCCQLPSGAPEVSVEGLDDVAAGATAILRHNQLLPTQIQQQVQEQQQHSSTPQQQQQVLPDVVVVYNDADKMQQHLAAAAAEGVDRQQHTALEGVLWVVDPFR